MKRGEPPKRKTPLKRSTTPLKRTRVKPFGRKAARERDALDRFRAVLHSRQSCEAPFSRRVWIDGKSRTIYIDHSSDKNVHPGTDAHHIWPEDRDCGIHDPARGLLLCPAAHRWAHANPEAAAIVGILRPVEVPLP